MLPETPTILERLAIDFLLGAASERLRFSIAPERSRALTHTI